MHGSFVELSIKETLFIMDRIAVESDVCKERSSFINGTNDREAYPKRWVAALVHTNLKFENFYNHITSFLNYE